jgi:alpha-tubulin suppressor-like RCC1 family protein
MKHISAGVNKDVDAGTRAVAVNSGTAALSVIMEDGGVFMFGQNTTGQISRCECLQNIDPNITIETTDTGYGGDGYTYFKFSAGSNLKPVKIDTSDNHTAILLNNGKVYVWGNLAR